MRILGILIISLVFTGVIWGGDISSDLKAADKDHDGWLDRDELANYFLKYDKEMLELSDSGIKEEKLMEKALDLADDALSIRPSNSTKITLEDALSYIKRRASLKAKEREIKLWRGFRISRTLTDESDPRKQTMDDRAFVIAYSYDKNRQDKKGLFMLLGTVTLFDYAKDWSGGEFQIKPGLDLDVDTSLEAVKDSVDVGLNFSLFWFNDNPDAILSSHVLSLTPKYRTDRNFNRTVYEAALTWSFASKQILRSGYNTWIGGGQKTPDDAWFRIYWKPQLGAEAGRVQDAAGSEALQQIKDEGSYIRLSAGGKITITPLILAPKLSASASYTIRWDIRERWNKYYFTAEVAYDISKNVQFTVLYRKGAKPPFFMDIDAVLVGLGILIQ